MFARPPPGLPRSIRRTPVLFDVVDERRVFFKCENLQRGGAFKLRGASNLILSLAPEQLWPRHRDLLVRQPRSGGSHRRHDT